MAPLFYLSAIFVPCMLAGPGPDSAPATVIERSLGAYVEKRDRERIWGPYYRATIRFRKDDGTEYTWKGTIDGKYPEEVLRLYDLFQPGARVPIPATNYFTERPEIPEGMSVAAIVGALAAFALVFILPALWMFGFRSWFTNPVRVFAIFGLGAMVAGALIGRNLYRQQTEWRAVEVARAKTHPLERLESRAPEVTINDMARQLLSSKSYDVLIYEVGGVRYEYALVSGREPEKVGVPCQTGESCGMLYNPSDPTDLAVPQPLNEETFAGPLVLAGFGLVFLLIGLLAGRKS
jgi:hypothetical protein